MNNYAHFFWHGKLSQLEISCISSFYNNGFQPILWSYENLKIANVESRDASEILSKDHLTKYSYFNSANLAAFSDVFRIILLTKYSGWWFDTDCYCLKNYAEFEELSVKSPLVIGFEDQYSIASGVLKYTKELSQIFLVKLNEVLKLYNNNLPEWGIIGPKLFTDCIQENKLLNHVLSPQYFYPIHYSIFNCLYNKDPKVVQMIDEKIKNSYVIHLWNEMITRSEIDKFDDTLVYYSWMNKEVYRLRVPIFYKIKFLLRRIKHFFIKFI
jgi:hypothetical protein